MSEQIYYVELFDNNDSHNKCVDHTVITIASIAQRKHAIKELAEQHGIDDGYAILYNENRKEVDVVEVI